MPPAKTTGSTNQRSKAKQDEFTQRRRLANGSCPVHGVALSQVGVMHDSRGEPYADRVACPRKDCDREFLYDPRTNKYGHIKETRKS